MSQKIDLTKIVMKELEIEQTPKNIKRCLHIWWQSPRTKQKKGFWLSPLGLEAFKQANIKSYLIKLNQPIDTFENKFIIWLDNFIDCPFYLTNKDIHVFGEKTAIQMILFSGNLKLWYESHTKYKSKILDKTL